MALYDQEKWDGTSIQSRLAGITKLGDIVYEAPLAHLSLEHLAKWTLAHHKEGKILFGFTVYGGSDAQRLRVDKLALPFKRLLQTSTLPVRWVTGKEGMVSPAAVEKLNLTNEGFDFVFGIVDKTVYIGRTTHVQDATAWSTRDYGRPFRDTKTGMLPPKLARLMVNLGCGQRDPGTLTILDPFCGGGTILMEAALIGAGHMIGSDIDSKQAKGSEENNDWLVQQKVIRPEQRERITLLTSPAQELHERLMGIEVDLIVTEGYLGHPLQGNELQSFLDKQKREVEKIWMESLASLAKLQLPGGKVVCIWPTYTTKTAHAEVDLTAQVRTVGYERLDMGNLLYGREDQHVKRQVVLLERN